MIRIYDEEDVQKYKPEAWMIEALKMNPSYVSWGNYEDYMIKEGGWDSACEIDSVNDLWELDELNELVNFYFFIDRKSKKCCDCEGSGLNPETKRIQDDWYDFEGTGRKWCNNITQHEVDALWEARRLRWEFKEKPTAEQVNAWSRKGLGHDGINRMICVKARAEREGVYGFCPKCEGDGYIFIEENCRLCLQMWIIHPRKGCSRGVILKDIKKEEVPKVVAYLKKAAERNSERFSKL